FQIVLYAVKGFLRCGNVLAEPLTMLLSEQLNLLNRRLFGLDGFLAAAGFPVGQRAEFRVDRSAREAFEQFRAFVGPCLEELGKLSLGQQGRAKEPLVIQSDQLLDQHLRLANAPGDRLPVRFIHITLSGLDFSRSLSPRAANPPLRAVNPGRYLE